MEKPSSTLIAEIPSPEKMIRLSVSEASRIFGVESKTIRRAIKGQKLRYVVVRGRYRISFASLLEWSQERKRIQRKLDKNGIGQYVERWKIKNVLYSPNPEREVIPSEEEKKKETKRI